ncbi:MAG TPA: methionyl-tRNA formyltransferase [Candidatus Obscuribacterales bacterium]
MDKLRVLFLGTPEFAVPTLKELIAFSGTDVVGAVCQPDRPAGRGNKLHVPPVKAVAESHSIPVLQPESLAKSPETVEAMRQLEPDLIVMVAFGQILKKNVLTLPKLGVMNLHGSLLPEYRGAAPINWAIINGNTVSGITTMFTDVGVDTGPMLLREEVDIPEDMNAIELAQKLSEVGSKLVISTIKKLMDGSLVPEAQDDSKATYAPMLTKELGHIDWAKDARQIHNLVRGLVPWPTAYSTFKNSLVKILKTQVSDGGGTASKPGTLTKLGEHVLVACGSAGDQLLELLEVQPANKNRMRAQDWSNGVRLTSGEAFE